MKKSKTKPLKYREYRYTSSANLLDIVEIEKLPKNARKAVNNRADPNNPIEVWVAPGSDGQYSKICRIESDITFGTCVKSIEEI